MKTNIIDKPRLAGAVDGLGVDRYMLALTNFIEKAEMPTTIAIQGEWGSGKTSMMNQILNRLCETDSTLDPDKSYYGVWLNTWQYSMMNSHSETLIAIINGISQKILKTFSNKHSNKSERLVGQTKRILGIIGKAAAKSAVSMTGVDGDSIIDGVLSSSEGEQTVLDLKNALQASIRECLDEDQKKGENKRGFLFFVDDLDRLDPPVAVEILELVKNIFEVENCIFLLAIDYEVVVKGLEPKFGKLTKENEREFRSFFYKIIQLPFNMPLSSYDINKFLVESLKTIGYFNDAEIADETFRAQFVDMTMESVGTNPRAIKRLVNTLSLIMIINELEPGDFGEKKHEKLMNFGLVCLQIAYPPLYELVANEPNFLAWGEKFAKKYGVETISDSDRELIQDIEEFDEEWEKIVYQICQNDAYLQARTFNISSLMNLIRTSCPENLVFDSEIERAISLSAVTNVSSEKINSKQKGTKVRMAGWDSWANNLLKSNINQSILDDVKIVHDYCLEKLGSDNIEFQYTPK